jgi:hypothetical protein
MSGEEQNRGGGGGKGRKEEDNNTLALSYSVVFRKQTHMLTCKHAHMHTLQNNESILEGLNPSTPNELCKIIKNALGEHLHYRRVHLFVLVSTVCTLCPCDSN